MMIARQALTANTFMPSNSSMPGEGFLGWLGRQVGHVAKAIQTDVAPTDEPPVLPPREGLETLYHAAEVTEVPHPTQSGVVLRRTVTDEVVRIPAESPNKTARQSPDDPPAPPSASQCTAEPPAS